LVDFAVETGQGFTSPEVLTPKKPGLSNQQTAGCFQHVVSYIIPCEATGTGTAWVENLALMAFYNFFSPGIDESMKEMSTESKTFALEGFQSASQSLALAHRHSEMRA